MYVSLLKFIVKFIKIVSTMIHKPKQILLRAKLGYCHKSVILGDPDACSCPQKIFLYENSFIHNFSKFIISPKGIHGRFIMKKYSGAAQGLTIITGNHTVAPGVGKWQNDLILTREGDTDKDVIVEEDVWIGANVTICSGVTIGRGSIVGAGSVCRTQIPPYSIAIGNPSRVIAFKYTPNEIINHELLLYPKEERLPLNILEKNYRDYYINRVDDIVSFIRNK